MTTKAQRTRDAIAAPDAIDSICAFITAGGTLAAWCRSTKRNVLEPEREDDGALSFEMVAAWIELDDDRRKRYKAALDVRERHHKDEIIEQLRNMVTADLMTAFADDGTLLPVKDIPVGVRHWIAGMEVEELWEGRGENRAQVGVLKKVRFWDKVRSTELLMRNLKMLIDRHEVTGVSLADLIAGEEARKT